MIIVTGKNESGKSRLDNREILFKSLEIAQNWIKGVNDNYEYAQVYGNQYWTEKEKPEFNIDFSR
jgi:hypothetical protein